MERKYFNISQITHKLAQISGYEHTPVSIVEVSLFVDTLATALVAGEGEVAGRELHETVWRRRWGARRLLNTGVVQVSHFQHSPDQDELPRPEVQQGDGPERGLGQIMQQPRQTQTDLQRHAIMSIWKAICCFVLWNILWRVYNNPNPHMTCKEKNTAPI